MYCYEMQCNYIRVNTVIHAGPFEGGEIHNETPLSRLTLFSNEEEGKGGEVKGPETLPKDTSVAKYSSLTDRQAGLRNCT